MNKKELRKNMIQRLSNLNETRKIEMEEKIYDKLFNYLESKDYKSVGVVLSMPHELNTWPIIYGLQEKNIEVYGPKSNYEDKTMDFYQVFNKKETVLDEKNITIPDTNNKKNNALDLLIVPGLIFNREGYRIGYGGGFYDRFISTFKGDTVSVLFDEQIGEIIVESHDYPVDLILTPNEVINTKGVRCHD